MRSIIITSALLTFALLGTLFVPRSSLAAASDTVLIEQIIKTTRKPVIISIIRKHRQNHITVIINGQMRESIGPPDEKYVNAKSVLEDLRKMHLSVTEFKKMVDQATATQTPNTPEILYIQAKELFWAGQYDQALKSALIALKEAETRFGNNSIGLSKSLSLLAYIQSSRQQYQDAAQYLARLKSIQEDSLGKDHGAVADTISRLIEVYEKLGNVSEANRLNNLAASRWNGGTQMQETEQTPKSVTTTETSTPATTIKDLHISDKRLREEQNNKRARECERIKQGRLAAVDKRKLSDPCVAVKRHPQCPKNCSNSKYVVKGQCNHKNVSKSEAGALRKASHESVRCQVRARR